MSFFLSKKIIFSAAGSAVIFLLLAWSAAIRPPSEFPAGSYFFISAGEPLSQIALSLEKEGIIRSPLFFRGLVSVVFWSGNDAVAGDYFFEKPLTGTEVAWRIVRGKFVARPIKVTIPEGLTKFETAAVLAKTISGFDEKIFADRAREGYVFPDTYYFAKNARAEDVVKIMEGNFERKIAPLKTKIENKIGGIQRPLDDIIKIASILETEAAETETRKIIAGILWKRLDIKMPLQVDVSFRYINGKNSFELTGEDLAIDSPYNTYKYAGLPPTPISNPSLDAIEAAVTPTATKYLYFLSDKTGEMHYAATFEEHKANKSKYLQRNW